MEGTDNTVIYIYTFLYLPRRDAARKAALLLAEMEDVEYVAPKEKSRLFNSIAT